MHLVRACQWLSMELFYSVKSSSARSSCYQLLHNKAVSSKTPTAHSLSNCSLVMLVSSSVESSLALPVSDVVSGTKESG